MSMGKTWVILPIPWVLPVRNNNLDPVLMNSGCCKKRKRTDAVSLVEMCFWAIIPSSTAVCWMLPMCTVVWNPLCMLVEWNSTTIVAYNATSVDEIAVIIHHYLTIITYLKIKGSLRIKVWISQYHSFTDVRQLDVESQRSALPSSDDSTRRFVPLNRLDLNRMKRSIF